MDPLCCCRVDEPNRVAGEGTKKWTDTARALFLAPSFILMVPPGLTLVLPCPTWAPSTTIRSGGGLGHQTADPPVNTLLEDRSKPSPSVVFAGLNAVLGARERVGALGMDGGPPPRPMLITNC